MFKHPVYLLLLPLCIIIILFDAFVPVFFISDHYSKHIGEHQYYKVLIKSDVQEREKTNRYLAEVTHYSIKDSIWVETKGDILIYFYKKDSLARNLKYGDVITTNSKLTPINNFEGLDFDYKKFMQRKRIYYNIFIKGNNWKKIGEGEGNFIISKSRGLNQLLRCKLLNSNLPKSEYSLAVGMLLGDKSYIDDETRQKFTSSGLTHILCVSGLHIGIIIFVFDFLFKILSFGNYRLLIYRKILLAIIAFAIAAVVGLSPSALRAATMFAILILTKYSSRGYDSINTLGVTALIFLIIDPLVLFNWSFQFSFLAVLGILLFSKKLTPYRKNRNFFLRSIFNTIGVTISAQIFVLPLILWRFKTFPTYSILANIVVIPMLGVVLITTILFLLLGDIAVLGGFIETILHYELYIMKSVVEFIDSLPYSSVSFS